MRIIGPKWTVCVKRTVYSLWAEEEAIGRGLRTIFLVQLFDFPCV